MVLEMFLIIIFAGKFAIVTGGRIKIGFHAAVRLLRDGCFVIVTTRFAI